MVKLMLDGLGGDSRLPELRRLGAPLVPIECHHVNCRVSDAMKDIGEVRLGKLWLVLGYCIQAVWCRFRHGVRYFYYVPAPGKRPALYRDWLVMLLCRPFFKFTIFHWHAVGLGDWLHREGWWHERIISHWLLGHPAMSISLAIAGMRDALWFKTRDLKIVPNGIPDPCPDFEEKIRPMRLARAQARRELRGNTMPMGRGQEKNSGDPAIFKVLYLAHCTREKGVFDTIDAVSLSNTILRAKSSPVQMHLTVAGDFLNPAEEHEFRQRIQRGDISTSVTYAGFLSGPEKVEALRTSDCYCFPTYYEAEGLPVSLIEAMAFGLCIVTTRWRAIPEILPHDHAGFVTPRATDEIAAALLDMIPRDGIALREQFLGRFSMDSYLGSMREVFSSLAEAQP